MIKEQAIDTLTLGNVSVTETDYCGDKVAVMASDGIYHWCDLCGKAEVACTHDRRYAYGTDARLYGTDAETGKRRQLTPEEAYWYIYDGQSDEFGNVGENARTPEVRIEGVVRGTHRGKELNMKLPKSMSKYSDRIEEIWSEGDDGYWVDYKPGWRSFVTDTHMSMSTRNVNCGRRSAHPNRVIVRNARTGNVRRSAKCRPPGPAGSGTH